MVDSAVDIVLLALGEGGCGARTPILACQEALRTAGANTSIVTASADADIDQVIASLGDARLIVATAADGQLRAVVRRFVRALAPAPSKRPSSLRPDRTVPDLPPLGVLPLDPAAAVTPAQVASLVLGGAARRRDLLRTDGGSVTLEGALLGGVDDQGHAAGFRARVEVDDAVLSDGMEPILVAAVGNTDRYAVFDGLPLLTRVDDADGVIDVAVALPHTKRRLLGGVRPEIEVRRARGRAVAITPREEIPYVDDGIEAKLTHKRTWWMEAGAWAVYEPAP